MWVRVADGLPCQPHDLARDVLSSLGHVNSMELLIAELSHKRQAPFQSQRSKESAVWLFFQSPGAHSAAVRWTLHSHSLSTWFEKRREGEGCEVLPLPCCSESGAAVRLLPESEATDTWGNDEEAELMLTLTVGHKVSGSLVFRGKSISS